MLLLPQFWYICMGFFAITSQTAHGQDIENHEQICTWDGCKDGHLHPESPVYQMCSNKTMTNQTRIYGRCCLNSTGSIKGIDLSFCNISQNDILNIDTSTKSAVEILILGDSNFDCHCANCSNNTEIYRGFSLLKLLTLPGGCLCPNEDYWNHTKMDKNVTECVDELNYCVADNATCPSHSLCLNDGPGFYQCICDKDSGYRGYKCFRQGYIPVLPFSIGAVGVTVLAGAGSVGIKKWFINRAGRGG